MKTAQQLLGERITRIQTAVALGKPDRVPLVLLADSFCANHLGVKMSEFCTNPKVATEAMLKSLTSLGEFDAIEMPSMNATLFSMVWLSNMKLPGRELPEGTVWQVDEEELMKVEDYDTIIQNGYNAFAFEYLATRMRDKQVLPQVKEFFDYLPAAAKTWIDAGIMVYSPVATGIPYDTFMGARTMSKFTKDLFKIPDKVEAVLDIAANDTLEALRQTIRMAKPMAVWVSGMRGASEFVSRKIFDRFVWPHTKKFVEAIIEEGSIAYLHFDANWERDLEYFRDLPKGKCVFGTDSATDIYKVKEVLGDHMCIMGDVPAALLTLGTPDEVYKYCTKLINEIGPSGYILSQGCDVPPNAKPENVAAMMAAASGK
ncbi:MAG: uroD [Caproiciproducens sp.]|nr:uroD [Caproiciproducens sp.]